jgi:hypothetical protein
MLAILLLFIIMFYLIWNLPRYLAVIPWFRCLENWVLYRVWTSCRHAHPEDIRIPVHMGGVSAIFEMSCADCGTVFLRDSFPEVSPAPMDPEDRERIAQDHTRALARDARREQLRLWLCRWLVPALREGRRFAAYLGVLLTIALLAWLWWAPLRPIARDIFVAACSSLITVDNRETQ